MSDIEADIKLNTEQLDRQLRELQRVIDKGGARLEDVGAFGARHRKFSALTGEEKEARIARLTHLEKVKTQATLEKQQQKDDKARASQLERDGEKALTKLAAQKKKQDALEEREEKKRTTQRERSEKKITDDKTRADENFVKTRERVQRMIARAESPITDPNQMAVTGASAVLAAGGTVGEALGVGGLVHVGSTIRARWQAGQQRKRSQALLDKAIEEGDTEGVAEHGGDVATAARAAATATGQIWVTAAIEAARLAIGAVHKGVAQEGMERTLFQTTGARSDFLKFGSADRLADLGLSQPEAMGLATQLGSTGAVTSERQLRKGDNDLFGTVARIKQNFGDAASSSAMQLLQTAVQRGAVGSGGLTGDAAEDHRNRQGVNLLARAQAVMTATGLERPRLSEALQTMSGYLEHMDKGIELDPKAYQEIATAVGSQGPAFKGTGGAAAIQQAQDLLMGEGGNVSKMISMQAAIKKAGPGATPIDINEAMATITPEEYAAASSEIGLGGAAGARFAAFAKAPMTRGLREREAAELGARGLGKDATGKVVQAADLIAKATTAAKPEPLPADLVRLKRIADADINSFGTAGGEAARNVANRGPMSDSLAAQSGRDVSAPWALKVEVVSTSDHTARVTKINDGNEASRH